MNTIIKTFIAFCVSMFVMTSCSKDEIYTNQEINPVDNLTSKTWKVEIDDTVEEYVSTVTIVLNRAHTYRYTQNIVCGDNNDVINITTDGNWEYNDDNKTISLVFTDKTDNIQYIEKGFVDFNTNTISIQNKKFKY